jgi:phosphopentomutase
MKRVFLIVLDSFGIGAMPDSADYGDTSVNTLRSISKSEKFKIENLKKMGLFNIDGVECGEKQDNHTATICRLKELSKGKDTTIGHWEIAGIVSQKPLPTYPDGFPESLLNEFTRRTGRKVICNKPYSGTDVIRDYGDEHIKTGALIVYTSADSVFQIAAHEDIVPLEELYNYCKIAREILCGEHGVGRVIARPFKTENGTFVRTANRHDYSLQPPKDTMLDILKANGKDTIAVGKIYDIFAGRGITSSYKTSSNLEGIEKTLELLDKDFSGLCFVNLVDFDMLYGHRNDIDGYAHALSELDSYLPQILEKLRNDDLLIITADHGCDPGDESTDHTREYVPVLVYGKSCKKGVDLGIRESFADVGATVSDILGVKMPVIGKSFKGEIL